MDPHLSHKNIATQVCYVTDDLERSIAWFANLTGLEAPAINATPADGVEALYHGKTITTSFRQGIFHLDNIAVEFIEPGPGPSAWRDVLEERGPCVHHIAFDTRNMTRASAHIAGQGMAPVQSGEFTGGRYAYFDALTQSGAMIELLEFDKDMEKQD